MLRPQPREKTCGVASSRSQLMHLPGGVRKKRQDSRIPDLQSQASEPVSGQRLPQGQGFHAVLVLSLLDVVVISGP